MISSPGLYDLSHAEYHADPVHVPSLSASIAHKLIDETPRHAWHAHPRLGNGARDDGSDATKIGTVAHALILEGINVAEVIDADSWRTKAAKEARDAAVANGKVPVLAPKWPHIRAMCNAACDQLDAHADLSVIGTEGKTERTLIWQSGPTWFRARPDVLVESAETIIDLKTTDGTANPEIWSRRAYDMGHDLRAEFYLRGTRSVLDWQEGRYLFAVLEQNEPFALSIVGFPPASMHMAARKYEAAVSLWEWCMANDKWPGWPAHVAWVDPPPWTEKRWLERELREMSGRDRGEDLRQQLIEWQRPK